MKTSRGKKIYSEMLAILDEAYSLHIEKETIPKFKNVRPRDVKRLHLEVCERNFRFDKIKFFSGLPHAKWLKFYEHMEKRMYNVGDYIYQKGSKSTHFFVIRKGKAWFMQSQEKHNAYPFAEVDSYFGEFELFEESTRRWTVLAKTFLVVYAIPRNEFLDLLKEREYRDPFLKNVAERYENFIKFDRECSRAVRRLDRVEHKIKEVKLDARKKLEEKILISKNKSAKDGNANWYRAMEESQKRDLEKKIEA